jgi:MOSC domain-containing protein YiiM
LESCIFTDLRDRGEIEMSGKVVAVCISEKKGTQKKDVGTAVLIEDKGLKGDAHAGFAHRQVSLLNAEDIREAAKKLPDLAPGSFAENITVEGFDVSATGVGEYLSIGECLLEVTQIGKECHSKCEIYYKTGDCIMPRKGVFCRVIRGGRVSRGDEVNLAEKEK